MSFFSESSYLRGSIRIWPASVLAAVAAMLLATLVQPAGAAPKATGGETWYFTENGTNFVAHIFTTNDTFVVNSAVTADILIGGGGGSYGGPTAPGAGPVCESGAPSGAWRSNAVRPLQAQQNVFPSSEVS
jgi:hypothetical protein